MLRPHELARKAPKADISPRKDGPDPQLSYRNFDLRALECYRNEPRFEFDVDDIHGRKALGPVSEVGVFLGLVIAARSAELSPEGRRRDSYFLTKKAVEITRIAKSQSV